MDLLILVAAHVQQLLHAEDLPEVEDPHAPGAPVARRRDLELLHLVRSQVAVAAAAAVVAEQLRRSQRIG